MVSLILIQLKYVVMSVPLDIAFSIGQMDHFRLSLFKQSYRIALLILGSTVKICNDQYTLLKWPLAIY